MIEGAILYDQKDWFAGIENLADQLFNTHTKRTKAVDTVKTVKIKPETLMLFLKKADFLFALQQDIWELLGSEAKKVGMDPFEFAVTYDKEDKFKCVQEKIIYTFLSLSADNGLEI